MQCGIEEKTIKSVRMLGVKCFRCEEEGHKCIVKKEAGAS